jgi:hypothetical protein
MFSIGMRTRRDKVNQQIASFYVMKRLKLIPKALNRHIASHS